MKEKNKVEKFLKLNYEISKRLEKKFFLFFQSPSGITLYLAFQFSNIQRGHRVMFVLSTT